MYDVQLVWWVPLVGTLIWMACGAIWYHPQVMGGAWMKHTGLTEEILQKKIDDGEQSMGLAFGSMAAAGLVMNFILLHIVQYGMFATDTWGVIGGMTAAAWCWMGFVAVDVGAYGFEGRTWKLWHIDKLWIGLAILFCGAVIGAAVNAP